MFHCRLDHLLLNPSDLPGLRLWFEVHRGPESSAARAFGIGERVGMGNSATRPSPSDVMFGGSDITKSWGLSSFAGPD